jgi:hypothetical protein
MARQCLSGGDYELLQRAANASFAPALSFSLRGWCGRWCIPARAPST